MTCPGRLHAKFTITNAVTAGLTRIERARGFLEAAKVSEDWVRSMGARVLVLEAHHKTHIEGRRRTLDPLERILAGKCVPGPEGRPAIPPAGPEGHDGQGAHRYRGNHPSPVVQAQTKGLNG